DTTSPGETDGLPPVEVVAPRGGELWPLSRDGEPSARDIVWTMSDDVRVCGVEVDLLHSEDGGQTFPSSLRLESFGSGAGCFEPGEATTRLTYPIPTVRPLGGAGSLYKVRITVTDHAGNSTTAESDRPFYLVEPNNDSVETLVLWHPDRMEDFGKPTTALATALANLADHPAVQGRLVDLGLSDELRALYEAWDAASADDGAAPGNALLFAEGGLRDYLHDEWLASFPAVESIVLVGGDRLIPFARLPDGTAAATVEVSEEAYPSDPVIDSDVDLTPDGTRVGRALAEDHYLSDDPLATRGRLRPNDLDDTIFLPDLGIGRLVETPDEIIASIAAFISSDGVVDLAQRANPVFVSAYDFLVDAGTRIEARWQTVLGDGATEALIGQTWTSSDLTASLCLPDGYGVVSLNGHATHHQVGHPSAGGPYVIDGTPTTDLVGCDLTGSLVYAIGCHSGLSVSDDTVEREHDHPFDMPQAMLGSGALAFLGNTGYGWGLRHGVGYSERLVELFTQELAAGGVEIGEAVRRTKTRYYLESPYFDPYDEKVSMQWTLYGFPMLRLRTGSVDERNAARPFEAPPPRPESVPRVQQLGPVTVERRVVGKTVVDGVEVVPPAHLSREPRSFDFRGDRVYKVFNAAGVEVGPFDAPCDRSKPDPDPDDGIPQGCYRTLNGLASGQDIHSGATDRPLQPLLISDVGLSGTRFHGFLWLGGTYVEQRHWVPLFAELQSNVDGGFSDRGALPSNSKGNGRGRIRHGGVLGDECSPSDLDRTSLVLEAGEVLRDADDEFSIERHYQTIDTELFYYNNSDDPAQNCDVTGPQVIAEHAESGSTITWRVRPHPDAVDPIWRVVVVWTDNAVDANGRGRWRPLELAETGGVFEGSIDGSRATPLTYFVQAVDERGNVSVVSADDPGAASGVTHDLPKLVEVDRTAGESDLGVTLDASPDPLPALTTLSLVVEVTNHGPDAARGVSATIELPESLHRVGFGGSGWNCTLDVAPVQCSYGGSLAVGATAPIYVFGMVRSRESIDFGASVQSRSVDRVPENDRASLSVGGVPASVR
ncbi:MAG: C25 family cysteine peptidase, partial [Acidobacteriota bacterium]